MACDDEASATSLYFKNQVLTKKYRKVRKNIPVSILSERRFFGTCQRWHKTEIELKSLILAQIERWRHALHMQVERQHGCLHLVASGERVSNISERALEWGIT